ncbi:phosphate/phosphite/phosphonate ABC transporter substrate-binding protein [Corynebacterium doosanense]|uniref:Phosphate starvation-inducible protein PhoH n=1 Tax=Corynebacterium doosanense CAU 212 = DSM 45436 TaxID=558173 RepID=A0A097IFP6_9CORY|nr:phosphate/phosphite/phosphonate ABC transporter substrate-binding protein [Corynebacterium doosanense]AIT60961.1 phosphate starvation-inducible protein PhoH [Corynebacterium doosanense CAU 212 = DSM 45436]
MIHRPVSRSAAVLGVAALLPLGLVACDSDSSSSANPDAEFSGESITLAAVPSEESTTLESAYGNIADLLEKQLGVEVTFQNANDYAAVIEGQRAGQIDMASYGPFSYVIASDSGVKVEPIATLANAADEEPSYTSQLHVPAGSDIKGLEDLRGKNVCFVDAASTSGYLVPSYGLLGLGIDPEKDLTPVMAGGHDASLLSLDGGNCDAAFAQDTQLGVLEETGQIKPGSVEVVWQSDPIPSSPLTANTDTMSAELVEAVKKELLENGNKEKLTELGICDSVEDCVLPDDSEWGYLPVTDENFDVIREICEVTQADACNQVG